MGPILRFATQGFVFEMLCWTFDGSGRSTRADSVQQEIERMGRSRHVVQLRRIVQLRARVPCTFIRAETMSEFAQSPLTTKACSLAQLPHEEGMEPC